MWWYTQNAPVVRRLRQEDCHSMEASLSYVESATHVAKASSKTLSPKAKIKQNHKVKQKARPERNILGGYFPLLESTLLRCNLYLVKYSCFKYTASNFNSYCNEHLIACASGFTVILLYTDGICTVHASPASYQSCTSPLATLPVCGNPSFT